MESMESINQQLYRPIKSGLEYEQYFPNSRCSDTKLATGDTSIAIKKMKLWAKKFAHHSENIAPVLQGSNLQQTVDNIQSFLYNHIQYSIDGEKQQLKSPACAWATREQGTDCKSYSIFASTILLNLGIKHYFRRIVQPQVPEAYTHVYVIVPQDQATGNLGQYYVIDGTIKYNNEVPFITNDDLYMNEPKLAIHGLAAATQGMGCASSCGCNSQAEPQLALNGFFDDIGGAFSSGGWSLSCIGGTYDANDAKKFRALVTAGYDALFAQFNNSLNGLVYSQDSIVDAQLSINSILKSAVALKDMATRCANKNWSSSCSKAASKSFRDDATYFHNIIMNTFLPYLNEFFTYTTTQATFSNSDIDFEYRRDGEGMKTEFVADVQGLQVENLELKNTSSTPYFIIDPELVPIADDGGVNVSEFLNSLSEIAITYYGNTGGTGGTGGNTGGTGGNVGQLPNNGANNTQAGFGTAAIIGLLAVGAGAYFYSKSKKS